MPNSVSSFIYMYADGTKVSGEVGHTLLQTDLNDIHRWSDTWQLKFNKSKVMHVGYTNKRAKYSMKRHGTEVVLEFTSEEKDLGIWIDDKLMFTSHVGHVIAKTNQLLGLIKRSFIYKDIDVITKLFTALVRPHLEYANTVWFTRYKKDWNKLKKFTEELIN